MIAELETDKKLVRFEWHSGYTFVNVQDYDKRYVAASRNVYADVAIAREMWKCLIRKGFERVVYIPAGGTDVCLNGSPIIHLNLNGESVNDS